jgi:hypothetical protein
MACPPGIIRVNRAPVLTLWAAVVAERLGFPPDTALSLASAVAATAARAKARRLGVEAQDMVSSAAPPALRPGARQEVPLLGKAVPVVELPGGVLMARDPDGAPALPGPAAAYVAKAFGPHLGAVRGAMASLAERLDPAELNRVGFRLYERFRPEVPQDVSGWGAKGELHLERILQAGP